MMAVSATNLSTFVMMHCICVGSSLASRSPHPHCSSIMLNQQRAMIRECMKTTKSEQTINVGVDRSNVYHSTISWTTYLRLCSTMGNKIKSRMPIFVSIASTLNLCRQVQTLMSDFAGTVSPHRCTCIEGPEDPDRDHSNLKFWFVLSLFLHATHSINVAITD